MKRKIFLTFCFALVVFGMTKVKAVTTQENVSVKTNEITELKGQIETNMDGTWKEFYMNQYQAKDALVYEIGNHNTKVSTLKIGQKQNIETNALNRNLVRILRCEYEEERFHLKQEEFYLATHMALNCMKKQYKEGTVGNYYRAKSGLAEEKKERINGIIEVANDLLGIGYSEEQLPKETVQLIEKGELEKDDVLENFYSQEYEVKTKGVSLDGFVIEYTSDEFPDYYIGDKNGRETSRFLSPENSFKIMVPSDKHEEAFEIRIRTNVNYQVERLFLATGNGNQYLVYGKTKEAKEASANYANQYSRLTINLVDEDTGEYLYGSIIEAKYTRLTYERENQLLEEKFGKEPVEIRMIWFPGDYVIPQASYIVPLDYKENRIETIKVAHQKGKLLIKTKLKRC